MSKPMSSEHMIKGAENELFCRVFTSELAKDFGVLCCHGLGTQSDEFGKLGEKLLAAHISCLYFDFSGHGKSQGKRNLLTESNHFYDTITALEFFLSLKVKKVILLGHSLGAHAALRVQNEVRSVIGTLLICPQMRSGGGLSFSKKIAFKTIGAVHKMLGTHSTFKIPLKNDPSAIFGETPQDSKISTHFLAQFIDSGSLAYLSNVDNEALLRNSKKPIYIFFGEKDKKVRSTKVKEKIEKLNKKNIKTSNIKNMTHSPFLTSQLPGVSQEIISASRNILELKNNGIKLNHRSWPQKRHVD